MRYTLDDLDIDSFVQAWLRHLSTGNVVRWDFLHAAADDPPSGGFFLISNVGLKPGAAFPTREQLVLYAVLTAYQDVDLRWVEQPWEGIDHHLQRAFAYANQLGRSGVARVLLERIAERSTTSHRPPRHPLLPTQSAETPAELAAEDRAVAEAIDHDIRAAALLDPDLSLDSILLDHEPPD